MPRLKNQHLDYEATTEPLCYVGLLSLIGSEWIFILNGWGKIILYPDLNSGHPHYLANTVPLCYADLLILNSTEWIFIFNGWGRGIKTVYTQI